MFRLKAPALLLAAALVVTALAPAAANDDMRWQAFTYNDETNKGRLTAHLTLGVPETDARQFQSICSPGSSYKSATTIIGYDPGRLKTGTPVTLIFEASGRAGRETYQLRGEIYLPNQEEGLSGILVRPDTRHKLWEILSTYRTVRYRIEGSSHADMPLKGSSRAIDKFLRDCRNIFGDRN